MGGLPDPRLSAAKVTETIQELRKNAVLRRIHVWPIDAQRTVGLDERVNHQSGLLDTVLLSPDRHVVVGVAVGRVR